MKKLMIMVAMVVCMGSVKAISIDEWCAAMDREGEAIEVGNWTQARYYVGIQLQDTSVPVNTAGNCVRMFLLNWNLEEKNEAIGWLRRGISIMKSHVGQNCSARAEVLLKKACSDEIGDTFTKNLFYSVYNYVMEVPNAVNQRKHRQLMARYDALIGQISASTEVYRREGEYQAMQAKSYANQEYQRKCHRVFDPDRRPSADSGCREEWDACKRIYDIFGD